MFPLLYTVSSPLLNGPLCVVVVSDEGEWEMLIAGGSKRRRSADEPDHLRRMFDDPDVGVSMLPFNRSGGALNPSVDVVEGASADAVKQAFKDCAAITRSDVKQALTNS